MNSIFKKLGLIFLALVLLYGAADAGRLLRGSAPVQASFSKTLVNVDGGGNPVINILHYCGAFANNFADIVVDANGYPIGPNIIWACSPASLTIGAQYTVIWPATRGGSGGTGTSGSFSSDASWSNCTAGTNVTITGCSGGSVIATQTTPGQPMRVTMTAGTNNPQNVGFGNGVSGSGEIAFIRTSDCLRFTGTSDCSGTSILEYLTTDVVNTYAGLFPRAMRFMNWTQNNFGNETLWSNRTTPNALGWNLGGSQFLSGTLSSVAVSGTNTYIARGAPNTPSSWTDGEQLVAGFTNGNTVITYSGEVNNGGQISLVVSSSAAFTTGQFVSIGPNNGSDPASLAGTNGAGWTITVPDSTHIVLNNSIYQSSAASFTGSISVVPTVDIQYCNPTCISRGAKQMVNGVGLGYISPNFLAPSGNSNSMYTMTYNARLDKVLLSSGSITGMVPLEVQLHLANLVGADFWGTIPVMYDNASVGNYWSTVCTNLNTSHSAWFEYGNELWNSGFNEFYFLVGQGARLGFPNGNGEQYMGPAGLRIQQIMGTIGPAAWASAGCSGRVNRVMAWQSGGNSGILTWLFKGADLVNNLAYSQGATLTCGAVTAVNSPFSGWQNGWPLKFTGSLCTGMTVGTTYYVSNTQDGNNTNFYLSTTAGGALLSTSGTASGVTATYTNPFYSAVVGANFNAKPNRPIDQVEKSSYAPYTGASAFFYGADTGQFGGSQPSSLLSPIYQSVINNWEAGNTSAAIATINSDIQNGYSYTATLQNASSTIITTTAAHQFVSRASGGGLASAVVFNATGGTCYSGIQCNNQQMYSVTSVPASNQLTVQGISGGFAQGSDINLGTPGTGTVTISWVGGTCLVNCTTWPYSPNWNQSAMPNTLNSYTAFAEWLAIQMDGDRPSGMLPLKTVQYEAALEVWPPPQSMVTTMGLTGATPEASLQNAVFGWLNSSSAAALQIQFYKQFMGTDPTVWTYGNPAYTHAEMPAQFGVYGPRNLSQSWAILSGSDGSAPYQLYNGIATYNQTP